MSNPANSTDVRIEKDSLGEVSVPVAALYGAQTQRAVDNFPVSGQPLPEAFITAIARIKKAAAVANQSLGLLSEDKAESIIKAADQIIAADYPGTAQSQFPIDVYQTGSGTSTNMNVNEVVSHLASLNGTTPVSPNDDVNLGQSSNDVIPSAIHVASALLVEQQLLPALSHLIQTLDERIQDIGHIVKTGRTHTMDAMPVTFAQEMGGWKALLLQDQKRLKDTQKRLLQLTLGGTAVGSGTNTHPDYSQAVCNALDKDTGLHFTPAPNFFAAQSVPATALELSANLRNVAVSLMKIANDLRWMNSGPLAGFGEIELPALQPGSSIMPGKINPVISESVTMVSAQIIGLDTAVTIAAQSGHFELNVMLPLVANNLVQSIMLASNASIILADKAIKGFRVREANINQSLDRNPILVTALNPIIGYMKAADIAKQAYKEKRSILEVAKEKTDLTEEELKRILDPVQLTKGGINKK
ncbi:aspartate ammonia-lyase [Endozoicomonas montiporae]|uniref:Fumarate hydratase class II n=2 Tax=Endozoicomonas montiporae TaxID=1027273 RepID=A0A081N3L1_9GAMM|nr:class II fumarate hydratase [Endozoicomonas montiporae]KEQ13034.1 aspartate ammonia-lyase [Endozoicomonas montiporae]